MRSTSQPSSPTQPWVLGLLAFGMLVPVTLPVAVLKGLVQMRFGTSEVETALFMSINMLGAVLAAPLAGAWVDRAGRVRAGIVAAVLLDALCFALLTRDMPYALFLAIRFLEGCAHISALSFVFALAAHGELATRGRRMGIVGAALTFGVALGAPLGALIGRDDPMLPLWAGAAWLALLACAARWLLADARVAHERATLAQMLAVLRARRELLAPLAYAFVDRFTVGFFTTSFPLYLKNVHATTTGRVGLLLALFLVPFALLSYPMGRLAERRSIVLYVCGGSALYGLLCASLGWWPPHSLEVLMLLLGLTSAVMFVPSIVMTTALAPQYVRSTALGAFNAAGSLGFILGPLTGTAIAQMLAPTHGLEAGYRAAFVVAGASEIVCVLVTLPLLSRLVRTRRIS